MEILLEPKKIKIAKKKQTKTNRDPELVFAEKQ